MKQGDRKLIVIILVIVIMVGAYFMFAKKSVAPDKAVTSANDVNGFAQCLKDSGAKFYGASWCSHCQNQKKLLENSKNIPYVECSTPDGKGQTQICADNKIEGYPTWVFADGSRESGELSFDVLSKKTGCALPQ